MANPASQHRNGSDARLPRRHLQRRRRDPLSLPRSTVLRHSAHDFTSFCKAREGATAIRRIERLHWDRDETGVATMTVVADAFCHSMVRALVGCLLAIGEGRKPVTWAAEMLERAERSSDIHIASPRGLTLEEVGYPPDSDLAGRLLITRARRQESELG